MQVIANVPDIIDKIIYFVDNNTIKHSMEICGKTIYSPEQLKREKASFPIIILSMMNAGDIVQQIHKLNIMNTYYVIK